MARGRAKMAKGPAILRYRKNYGELVSGDFDCNRNGVEFICSFILSKIIRCL